MTLGNAPAFREMSGEWLSFMGINRDQGISYTNASAFAKAPADEAWVFSCVRLLYQSAQGVPLRVYVKAGRDLVPATDEPSPEGDDLQNLLDYVNPVDMTGSELKAFTVASGAVWGESYWRKVRGKFGGPPQELYWLRAPDISVNSADGRTPSGYSYKIDGQPVQVYQPRDIVPFKTPNLVNPLRGLSPLSAIGDDIATSRMWAQRRMATVANDSVPPGFWQIPREAEFTKQDENLVRSALRKLMGPKNRGKTAIMPQGLDFKSIALTPHDAEMIASGKMSRMAVCAALGVPLPLAGDDEKGGVYASLRDAERVFWRRTMLPILDHYQDTLNNWLVPDFDPSRKRLTVAFDYSEIEALKPTLDVEWNMWLAGIYSQAIVPNEFRRHFRIGADVPWGAHPIPRTAVAIRPDPASLPVGALPTLDPTLVADLPDSYDVVTDPATDVSEALRAFGKGLYRHPAVKTWVADPDTELDTRALFGQSLPPAVRLSIEAGLRRRDSAAAIAAHIEVPT